MEPQQKPRAEYETLKNVVVHPKTEELPFQAREAINTLRGNIQLSGYNVKAVAVTSPMAHEGKSSLAFRLAKSLAALNKKTIYVDCDIRNSVVKLRYHIEGKTRGLSEYLCGKLPLSEVIYHTDDPWMDIIFTGASAPNPSELLSGVLFSQLIEKLKRYYDYVVVDTPPVNLVIDGAVVAKQCDGAVMVVESGVTERSQAIRAKRQLEYAGVKLLGVVLNKVGTKKSGYGYGYGHRYGYGYGNEDKNSSKNKRRKDSR